MYKTHLIRAPRPQDDKIKYPDGNTQDIINTVLYADKLAADYTKEFAASLKGKSLKDTCRNVWAFVKTQIPYKLDDAGYQWVKSPGRLWKDKAGDCKSFSVFTASCLRNLGIPYGYRFSSYRKDPTPTHVYVYVPISRGKEIILDSVWEGPFDTEKEYTNKIDYIMSEIHYLGSTISGRLTAPFDPRAHKPGELKFDKPIDQITDGEMDLLLARQRLEIEKMNSIGIAGPNNFQVKKYDQALQTVNRALANISNPDVISGMGENMIINARANGQHAMVGNIFKKIGKGIKKGVKAVTKVITAPLRLIAKGILEIYLPKAAPMFLYLFADEKLLTDKMRAKRKKAEKFKKFVVKKISMKEKHFMSIIRNKLTKNLKMSPESYLAKVLQNTAVKGIGSPSYTDMRINMQRYIGATGTPLIIPKEALVQAGNSMQTASKKAANKAALKNLATNLASGNPVGAVWAAIQWIISKLGGKKAEVDLSAADMPDIEGDAADAYNYNDLQNNYGNLSDMQRYNVKDIATELIQNDFNAGAAYNALRSRAPYLNEPQAREIAAEVEEGFEPIEPQRAQYMARRIKQDVVDPTGEDIDKFEKTGGGTGPGMCKC